MAVSLKINWTKSARVDLDNLLGYLVENWTQKESDKFLDDLMEFENLIAKYPESYVQSQIQKRFRLGFVNPLITCIYEIRKEDILIIALINNRQFENRD